MTLFRIYRKAARLVECGGETFACLAIRRIAISDADERFAAVFRPTADEMDEYSHSCFAWLGAHNNAGEPLESNRDLRVLALCFAAELARTGDL